MTDQPQHNAPRVAVIGDVGGHRKPFFGMLKRLGINTSTNEIPDDLTIIQVGDLIGAAPEPSGHILRTVRALRHHNPGQWIQLIGNWEARYHPDGVYFGAKRQGKMPDLSKGHQGLLNNLWTEQDTGAAAVIEGPDLQPALITHAGVTRQFLDRIGQLHQTDPHIVAAAINNAMKDPEQLHYLYAPGEMYQTPGNNPIPGPLWASVRELWRSWNEQPLPYAQIVGHAVPYMFNQDRWYDPEPIAETEWATPMPHKRMTYWRPPHSKHGIAHIDPGIWQKSTPEQLPAHLFPHATLTIPTTQAPSAQTMHVNKQGERATTIGDMIIDLLDNSAMTPSEFAGASGVRHDELSRYLNNQEIPTIPTLKNLAQTGGAKLIIAVAPSDQSLP